jgi:hypothetical protein
VDPVVDWFAVNTVLGIDFLDKVPQFHPDYSEVVCEVGDRVVGQVVASGIFQVNAVGRS